MKHLSILQLLNLQGNRLSLVTSGGAEGESCRQLQSATLGLLNQLLEKLDALLKLGNLSAPVLGLHYRAAGL